MTFKEKIVKLRKLKGLTQDEFASAVGVSRQAVYKWECGQSYPEVSKLLEIKALFNISIDDLLDENYEVIVPEKKKRKRIPKEVKREIEEKIEESVASEENESISSLENDEVIAKEPITVSAPVEEVKEEMTAVIEDVPTSNKEEKDLQPEEPVEEKVIINEKQVQEKKVGFLGRLFGRK